MPIAAPLRSSSSTRRISADDVAGTTEQIATVAPGVPVHAISARAGDGIAALEQYFDGNRTVGLIGSSGVGKSTLTNELLGRAAQATQEVRAHDSRGRHTTTHRQLFLRPQGGAIIDTPGMRGVELWNTGEDADGNFDDIEALALECKFRNCRHDSEPACAVRAAVGRGELEAERVARYVKRRTPGTPRRPVTETGRRIELPETLAYRLLRLLLDGLGHQSPQLLRLQRICLHLALSIVGLQRNHVLDVLGVGE